MWLVPTPPNSHVPAPPTTSENSVTSQNVRFPDSPIRNTKIAPGTVLDMMCCRFRCNSGAVTTCHTEDRSRGWMP